MTTLELILAMSISAILGAGIMYFYRTLVDRSEEIIFEYQKETSDKEIKKKDNGFEEKGEVETKKIQIKENLDEEIKKKVKDELLNFYYDFENIVKKSNQNILELSEKVEKNFEFQKDISEKIELNSDSIRTLEKKILEIEKKVENNSQKIESPKEYYDYSNLQVVDGIGPKIETILKENGIKDLKKLANTKPEEIRYILDKEGDRFSFHNPSSWPNQARIYLEKGPEELEEYQEFLRLKKVGV